jgi:hypothetical protein
LAHAAAGTNLQMANHVVLVEPAGHNKSHGAAIEAQAVGRCVRLGQTQVVTGACSAALHLTLAVGGAEAEAWW